MNCSARRPCFINHLFLTFDFCQVPRRNFLQFFTNRLLLHRHPKVSREVVEESLLTLQESHITLSLNWSMPYQGGCSRVLISTKGFDSSIFDWKNKFSFFFGKYHFFRIESFRVDFRCVHRLQLLKVCDQYVTFPNSTRVQSVSEEQSR